MKGDETAMTYWFCAICKWWHQDGIFECPYGPIDLDDETE